MKETALRKLTAISSSTIRKNNIKRYSISKENAALQYATIVKASPYILDVNEIDDVFTRFHENQSHFNEVVSLHLKSKFSIDNHKVYFIKHHGSIEFYIFDNDDIAKATCILFVLVLTKNWPRNGLFKSSVKGLYISHLWKSYHSTLQSNLTARFLRKVIAYLKYDYLVTDASQTVAANKAIIQFAKSYIDNDCVYVALSNRSSRKVVALIEEYNQLIEAMKLISTTNVSDMYKSIVILNQKHSSSSIYKFVHNDVKEFTYAYAKKSGYLTNHAIDNKEELVRRGYIIQDFEDISL